MWNVVVVLILKLWAIRPVLAGEEPPLIEVYFRMGNEVRFRCTTTELFDFPDSDWVLYRNSVPENTTDPCTSAGNFSSDRLLAISPSCDGLYSCAVQYTGKSSTDGAVLILSEPLPVYAYPEPTTTKPQSVNACAGQTVFLPSFFAVSALGQYEVTWSILHGNSIDPADNGVIASNYTYKLVNVSTKDVGTYFANVRAPIGTAKNGPQVTLLVKKTPIIDQVRSGDGIISLSVPNEEEFGFEWSVDGMIVDSETSSTFPLPTAEDGSEDIQIQATVFNDCENVTQTFIIPASHSTSSWGLIVAVALLATAMIIFIFTTVALCCYAHNLRKRCASMGQICQSLDSKMDELKAANNDLKHEIAEMKVCNANLQAQLVTHENRIYHSQVSSHTELVIHFTRQLANQERSINPIVNVLLEVVKLMWHWDRSDVDTLHGVYTFLDHTFKQVCRHHTGEETQKCIYKIKTMVHKLEAELERQILFARSASTPQDENTMLVVTSPQQETRQDAIPPTQVREQNRGMDLKEIRHPELQHQSRSAPPGLQQFKENNEALSLLRRAHQLHETLEELCTQISPDQIAIGMNSPQELRFEGAHAVMDSEL